MVGPGLDPRARESGKPWDAKPRHVLILSRGRARGRRPLPREVPTDASPTARLEPGRDRARRVSSGHPTRTGYAPRVRRAWHKVHTSSGP